MPLSAAFAGVCLFLSLVAFFLYAVDKSRARRGAWRIRESLLLGVGFVGGALGALLAMRIFRHKTKHGYFYVVNYLGLVWQIALLVYMITKQI